MCCLSVYDSITASTVVRYSAWTALQRPSTAGRVYGRPRCVTYVIRYWSGMRRRTLAPSHRVRPTNDSCTTFHVLICTIYISRCAGVVGAGNSVAGVFRRLSLSFTSLHACTCGAMPRSQLIRVYLRKDAVFVIISMLFQMFLTR